MNWVHVTIINRLTRNPYVFAPTKAGDRNSGSLPARAAAPSMCISAGFTVSARFTYQIIVEISRKRPREADRKGIILLPPGRAARERVQGDVSSAAAGKRWGQGTFPRYMARACGTPALSAHPVRGDPRPMPRQFRKHNFTRRAGFIGHDWEQQSRERRFGCA
jgi:hypothetical protein